MRSAKCIHSKAISISSLPLPPAMISQLDELGFSEVADFEDMTAISLARETGLSVDDSHIVMDAVRSATGCDVAAKISTLDEMYKKQSSRNPILTFCEDIDALLGGGVPLGCITEFCGGPGSGKTQMAMQLCMDVQIPEVMGGTGGSAILVDCDGAVMGARCKDIATSMANHLKALGELHPNDDEIQRAVSDITVDNLLSCVGMYRVHTYTELLSLVVLLDELLEKDKSVKLVVFDSISLHLRYGMKDNTTRSRVAAYIGQLLSAAATKHHVAIVVTNQLTTKISRSGGEVDWSDPSSTVVPALGTTWLSVPNHRVMLYTKTEQRFAYLMKSTSNPNAQVPFVINREGVRSVQRLAGEGSGTHHSQLYSQVQSEPSTPDTDKSKKRRRT